MRGERGILGVKKDHQMLFMFKGDEWPSSDSDDSDFEPGQKLPLSDSADSEDDVPSKPSQASKTSLRGLNSNNSARSSQRPTRKRTHRQKAVKRETKRLKMGSSSHRTRGTSATNADLSGANSSKASMTLSSDADSPFGQLPPELWLKIFEHVVNSQGAVPFLCRASKVCQNWRELARMPTLWQKVDLSYGWIKSTDSTLKWLAQNNLSQCREISLSGWKNVTNDAFMKLCENCHELEAVNLSNCSKLSSISVSALANGCPNLKLLDLSFTTADAVSVKSLKMLVEKVGSSLRELVLAGNFLTGFNLTMNAIMMNCPHLDTLDLSNCKFSTDYLVLNVEKLQESCPSLCILRLANCKVRANKDSLHCQGVGFEKLQELSCAMPTNMNPTAFAVTGVTDSLLVRLVHKAENLRLLDLRGCTNFNPRNTFLSGSSSPFTNLEQLYLSHSSITGYGDCLAPALLQWRHSLRVLDLAWTSPAEGDVLEALRTLTSFPSCPLTHLNLAGSTATLPSVNLALEKLRQLESLDLTSCRSLPRGIKCLHKGPKALNKLRATLLNSSSDSDTDSY